MRGVWCARVVLRAAACRVHVLSVFRVVHSGVRTHIYSARNEHHTHRGLEHDAILSASCF